MAERRMTSKKITESDAFLEMPLSAQCLYFHLNANADDDGFCNNPKRLCKLIGANDDDLKILVVKAFVLVFDSGVIVIKHWRINNYIQKDRYHETEYIDEKKQLKIKQNGAYTMDCIQDVYTMDTEDRLGKVRLGKSSIGNKKNMSGKSDTEDSDESKNKQIDEIIDYLNLRTGQQYRHKENSRKHIRARINDGFSTEECKTVIDKKCVEWMNNEKMKPFLRPETLFGNKFESYLNQPVKSNESYLEKELRKEMQKNGQTGNN